MITNVSELAAQRKQTAAFIAADPETIVLTPRVSEKTSSGGRRWVEQEPRQPQIFKVVEEVSRAAIDSHVLGGQQQEVIFTLVGSWDAQIESADIFDLRSAQWEVIRVDWDNGYEKRAAVKRYGR